MENHFILRRIELPMEQQNSRKHNGNLEKEIEIVFISSIAVEKTVV